MNKILVVEDDMHISNMLLSLLSHDGYDATPAFSGTEALLNLQQYNYDLILMDLMLPGKTGEDVIADIRGVNSKAVPIIALTARTDKETTVNILKLGADDYIAKPFDNNELLARIEVQLRRSSMISSQNCAQNLTHKHLRLNTEIFDVQNNEGMRANLSKREYEIMKLLISYPNKVFTKDNIYESVWGGEFLGDDNTINVHMSKLRSKLAAILPGEEYIKTVWGIGFTVG